MKKWKPPFVLGYTLVNKVDLEAKMNTTENRMSLEEQLKQAGSDATKRQLINDFQDNERSLSRSLQSGLTPEKYKEAEILLQAIEASIAVIKPL